MIIAIARNQQQPTDPKQIIGRSISDLPSEQTRLAEMQREIENFTQKQFTD